LYDTVAEEPADKVFAVTAKFCWKLIALAASAAALDAEVAAELAEFEALVAEVAAAVALLAALVSEVEALLAAVVATVSGATQAVPV